VAILQDDPERHRFNEAIEQAPHRLLSAANLLEISIVVESRHGAEGIRELDLFLQAAQVETVSVDPAQALAAREAFRRFGKGRHAAGLNFGDCFAYALAVVRDEPLLFKGEDFPLTDVIAAVPLH
jgi:ribonuclease VapC